MAAERCRDSSMRKWRQKRRQEDGKAVRDSAENALGVGPCGVVMADEVKKWEAVAKRPGTERLSAARVFPVPLQGSAVEPGDTSFTCDAFQSTLT